MKNLDLYKRFPIIESIPFDIRPIIKYAEVKTYQKNEVIFDEGEYGDSIHILLKGVVRLYRSSANGYQRTLMFVKKSEVYGNLPLVDNLVHNVTAEVFEESVNLSIPNKFVRKYIKEKPEILWYLSTDVVKKLRMTNQVVEEGYLDAERRIIRGLVLICEKFGVETERGLELRLRITQEELANFSGTTRVTVANVFSSLVEQGILSTKPKPWTINRFDLLKQLNY